MTKLAQVAATPSVNAGMKMSPEVRVRMRRLERDVFKYYDDMGTGKGNCTWGPGILVHRGPCSKKELARPVSAAAVEAEFARRVVEAEGGVIRMVRVQKLLQDQFDALVSLTYNAGVHGTRNVYSLVDTGRLAEAARQIRTMTSVRVSVRSVVARGLIARRAEESAPFDAAAKSAAIAKQ